MSAFRHPYIYIPPPAYVCTYVIYTYVIHISLSCYESLSPPTNICTYICYPYIWYSYHTPLFGHSAFRHPYIYIPPPAYVCTYIIYAYVIHISLSCYECLVLPTNICAYIVHTYVMHISLSLRGGGLGSRPQKMYGERLGDGVEYHLMKPTPRR